jgi:hypothetical protein
MILLAMKVLTIWTAAALAAGFVLGAIIRTAERLRNDEILDALFSYLAGRQTAR